MCGIFSADPASIPISSKTVKTCVDEKTYEEFEQSFSLENIRHLIADKVYEFGGDYRRKIYRRKRRK